MVVGGGGGGGALTKVSYLYQYVDRNGKLVRNLHVFTIIIEKTALGLRIRNSRFITMMITNLETNDKCSVSFLSTLPFNDLDNSSWINLNEIKTNQNNESDDINIFTCDEAKVYIL